ncbi:hypothetical protein O181_049750 [Austropuccinia psidii MF-1]|uniref:Uncharacterized protein n=1 Tax=Austropuccinia psidii MF-1 TaxID=1389203 RepID=A0A9Q3DZR7_9BASI|nr:hypothetical protein [Austropuccinia psidii MF-1]
MIMNWWVGMNSYETYMPACLKILRHLDETRLDFIYWQHLEPAVVGSGIRATTLGAADNNGSVPASLFMFLGLLKSPIEFIDRTSRKPPLSPRPRPSKKQSSESSSTINILESARAVHAGKPDTADPTTKNGVQKR